MTLRALCKMLVPEVPVYVNFGLRGDSTKFLKDTAGGILEVKPVNYPDCDVIDWEFAPGGFKNGEIKYLLSVSIDASIIGR